MSVSGKVFIAFILFSALLVWWFYKGVKVNVRRAREVAAVLEDVLCPKDKLYTWLGGVIGFSAEFQVDGFEKVLANFRMIPRHALLWLPFVWVLGRKDNLQLLFYLKKRVPTECHIVKDAPLKRVKVYNRAQLDEEELVVSGVKCKMFYKNSKLKNKLVRLFEPVSEVARHIALTPEKNVLYLEMEVEDIARLKDILKSFVERIT